MPFAAVAGGLAAGVGGSLVSGLMSPGVSGGGSSYYTPSGLGMADTDWQSLLSNLNNAYGANSANLNNYGLSSLQSGMQANLQYAPGYQNAANAAGAGYTNAGNALTGLGNLDLATQQSLLGAGQNVYQMGLDPQSALYDRTLNQLTQQTGATNSMYGLGSSAAGAGVQNQALSNFNIDWQNNQLSRALQGLQGYAGAANTAGSYGQAGGNALTLAPQYTLAGGATPYNTGQTIAGTPGSLGNAYGSFLNSNIYGPAEGLMSSIIPYMNYGAGAQSVPFQSQAQGAGAAGSMVSQGISGIGNAIQNAGGLGNFFNGTTGSFGGGDFSGAFTSNPYYSGGGNQYGFTMGGG
ncbi:hypothetical protein [Burkholderia sp. Z1]|uniref:hypothetical protein n=1 Tax=Burkholderia sp. Z1 TaxID=2759039 RepID=UPI001869038D|nr:hypothetical protein [Burkholderia sp. Z1]